MTETLRVLIIEDSDDDAELLTLELESSGYDLVLDRVQTGPDFKAALETQEWDIVLSDFSLPEFSAPMALQILRESGKDLPFIIVSGTIGEEAAVTAMRAGAGDFFSKNNIVRLMPAIERELRDAQHRYRRREVEGQLQYKAHLEKLLQEVAVQANSDELVPNLLHFVLEHVCQYTQMPLAHVFVPAPDNPAELVSSSIWYPADSAGFEAFRAATEARRVVAGSGLIGEVMSTREPVWVSGYSGDHQRKAMLDEAGLIGGVAFPVMADSTLAAVLEFYSYTPLTGDESLREIIPQIVFQISRAVERTRHVEALRQSEEQQRQQRVQAEALRDTAAILLNTTLDLTSVLDKILAQVALVIPHDAACVMLVDDDDPTLVRIAHSVSYARRYGDEPSQLLLRIAERDYLRRMHDTAAPVLIADTHMASGWHDDWGDDWIQSSLGAPLRQDGQIMGFLILDSAATGSFSEDRAEILQAFADLASTAIQNANLYAELNLYAATLEERVNERTAELSDEKDRVEAILNNSSDAICLGSFDAVIQRVNPAFHHLFGYHNGEIVERSLLSLVDVADVPTLMQALSAIIHDHGTARVEILAVRHDETRFDADVVLSAIVQQEKIQGIICGIRDITERKQAEREMQAALEQARELNELKARFTSMVSHEFRTPLAVIGSSVGILRQYSDRITEERRISHMDQIQSQIGRLEALLNDVLALSRAETLELEFNAGPLDMVTLCEDLVSEMQQTTDDHEIALTTKVEKHTLVGDKQLMRQAITNLLSNAIKYSPEGGVVQVNLDCTADRVLLEVHDSGIGIPQEEMKHLFKAFHRAPNVGVISGTGLGLPIVKRAVEAHGGTISVQSKIGEGSVFTIRIPLTRQTRDRS